MPPNSCFLSIVTLHPSPARQLGTEFSAAMIEEGSRSSRSSEGPRGSMFRLRRNARSCERAYAFSRKANPCPVGFVGSFARATSRREAAPSSRRTVRNKIHRSRGQPKIERARGPTHISKRQAGLVRPSGRSARCSGCAGMRALANAPTHFRGKPTLARVSTTPIARSTINQEAAGRHIFHDGRESNRPAVFRLRRNARSCERAYEVLLRETHRSCAAGEDSSSLPQTAGCEEGFLAEAEQLVVGFGTCGPLIDAPGDDGVATDFRVQLGGARLAQ